MHEIFNKKKLVIFDIMGVVFSTGSLVKQRLYPIYQDRFSYDYVKGLYKGIRVNTQGDISLWEGLGEKDYVNVRKKLMNSFDVDSEYEATKQNLLDIGLKLAILSNMPKEWSQHIEERLNLERDFNPRVFSGYVGMRKPDLEIYDYLIQHSGYKASDMVFIDDKLENLKSAKSLGMKTIHFEREKDSYDYKPDLVIQKFSDLY